MSEKASTTLAQMMFGFQLSRIVYVAVKLEIADFLSEGPKTISELAELTKTNISSLYRLMRALTSQGVFEEIPDQGFCLNAMAEPLQSNHPDTLCSHILMYGEEHFHAWDEIVYSIKTGRPGFDIVYKKNMYDYLSENPAASKVFNTAMGKSTIVLTDHILAAYDFSPYSNIVDVGGNQGQLLAAILHTHPNARGILFDKTHVVAGARNVFAEAKLLDRCQIIGGDLFDAVPSGGDLYMIKNALLSFDDETAIVAVKKIKEAMRPGAKFLILERFVDMSLQSKLMDLSLLVTVGGKARSEVEFRYICEAAGLEIVKAVHVHAGFSILESIYRE